MLLLKRREKEIERMKTSTACNDLIDYITKEQENDALVNDKILASGNPWKPKPKPCPLF